MREFVIKQIDEENIEITYNGQIVCQLNHDNDGRFGMERGEEIVRSIAILIGATIRIV